MILSTAILVFLVVLLLWSTVYLYASRWELLGSLEVSTARCVAQTQRVSSLTDEINSLQKQLHNMTQSKNAADQRLVELCAAVRSYLREE